MINYCKNNLYVKGPERERIAKELGSKRSVVDFEKILPVPRILEGMNSHKGCITHTSVHHSDVLIIAGLSDGAEMLQWDWVKNEGVETLDQLKEYLCKKYPCIKVHAGAAILREIVTGYTCRADWIKANWGVKNPGVGDERQDSVKHIRLTFYTEWEPPLPLIKNISLKYPDNTFTLNYFQKGNGYKGRYAAAAGNVLEDTIKPYFKPREVKHEQKDCLP